MVPISRLAHGLMYLGRFHRFYSSGEKSPSQTNFTPLSEVSRVHCCIASAENRWCSTKLQHPSNQLRTNKLWVGIFLMTSSTTSYFYFRSKTGQIYLLLWSYGGTLSWENLDLLQLISVVSTEIHRWNCLFAVRLSVLLTLLTGQQTGTQITASRHA